MKRRTFLNVPHTSDCCELNVVEIERRPPGCDYRPEEHFRLLSSPSFCKCGHPIHIAEPSQEELRDAWYLPEAEDE